MFPKPYASPSLRLALNPTAATPVFMFYNKMLFLFSQKMIRLQKPRRVYVFPSLRTVNPKPFNHTQPSNPQKSLYLLPVCPFAVLLFCSYFTALTPFLAAVTTVRPTQKELAGKPLRGYVSPRKRLPAACRRFSQWT